MPKESKEMLKEDRVAPSPGIKKSSVEIPVQQ